MNNLSGKFKKEEPGNISQGTINASIYLEGNSSSQDTVQRQLTIFKEDLKRWRDAVLTGNVNGLHAYPELLNEINGIGDNLYELAFKMEQEIAETQEKLAITMLSMQAQSATDLLHRGLFERTADVGAMADNAVIRDMLTKEFIDEKDVALLHHLLEKYVYEYSVYKDVIILDPQGKRIVSLNGDASPSFENSSLYAETVKTHNYTETFQIAPEPALYYSQPILGENNKILGIMVLSFEFEHEMNNEIFPDVLNGDTDTKLLLIAPDGTIAASSTDNFSVGQKLPSTNNGKIDVKGKTCNISVQSTNGYEGYMGFGLQGVAIKPESQNKKKQEVKKSSVDTQSVPESLATIIKNATNVETDLHIAGINGKLRADRENDKVLPPILDGIREAGKKIRDRFGEVIAELVDDTELILEQKAEAMSKLAMIVMDHNLYERANDVCWWADSAVYRNILAKGNVSIEDKQILEAQLAHTNNLYTVYDHLFIFDAQGVIQADSKPERSNEFVGKRMEQKEVSAVLGNKKSKDYFISSFEKTEMYDGKETYIYYATIFRPGTREAVGGIGLVFDSETQFHSMLKECLESENNDRNGEKAFGIYVNNKGVIVSSTHEDFCVGEIFDRFSIDDTHYIVDEASSVGYREYLRSDGHNTDTQCYVVIPRS